MYKLNLTEAYCPAQADTPMRERTIEEMLREQVETHGDGLALREMLAEWNPNIWGFDEKDCTAECANTQGGRWQALG